MNRALPWFISRVKGCSLEKTLVSCDDDHQSTVANVKGFTGRPFKHEHTRYLLEKNLSRLSGQITFHKKIPPSTGMESLSGNSSFLVSLG